MKLRAYLDLSSHLGIYFAPVYDIAASRLLSDVIGMPIKSACDCWIVDVGFDQTYNPSDTSVTFQLTLGGLGTVGEAPFGLNPFQRGGFLARQASDAARSPISPGTMP